MDLCQPFVPAKVTIFGKGSGAIGGRGRESPRKPGACQANLARVWQNGTIFKKLKVAQVDFPLRSSFLLKALTPFVLAITRGLQAQRRSVVAVRSLWDSYLLCCSPLRHW